MSLPLSPSPQVRALEVLDLWYDLANCVCQPWPGQRPSVEKEPILLPKSANLTHG